jgi:hypothetical protein
MGRAPMPSDNLENDEFTVAQTVEYLRKRGAHITQATLATLRSKGGGPPFFKRFKHIYYQRSDLDDWIAARCENTFGPSRQ